MKIPQKLANAYDFDHTIYRGDASLDFILYCLRHHPVGLIYLPFQAWIMFLYIIGKRDRREVKEAAFLFLKNLTDVDNDLQKFWNIHEHKIEDWFLDKKQPSDLIISASPEFLLKPILKRLELKQLVGTRMDKTNGKIAGKNCRAEEKVVRLKQYAPNFKIDSFYSDSLSDMPLLKLAKHPYVVKKGEVVTLHEYQTGRHSVDNESPSANSKKALLRELLLYGIIGGSTALLDVVLFHILVSINTPLLLANFISVSIAVGSSFILNAKYNFKKTDNLAKRAVKFFSIGYFGWFVQTIILLIGVDAMGYGETYVKIFAVFIAAAIQYLLNKFLTFRD